MGVPHPVCKILYVDGVYVYIIACFIVFSNDNTPGKHWVVKFYFCISTIDLVSEEGALPSRCSLQFQILGFQCQISKSVNISLLL